MKTQSFWDILAFKKFFYIAKTLKFYNLYSLSLLGKNIFLGYF